MSADVIYDNYIDAAIARGDVVPAQAFEEVDNERLRLKRVLPWAVIPTGRGYDVVYDIGPDSIRWVSRWRLEAHARADAEMRDTEWREHMRIESEEEEEGE